MENLRFQLVFRVLTFYHPLKNVPISYKLKGTLALSARLILIII